MINVIYLIISCFWFHLEHLLGKDASSRPLLKFSYLGRELTFFRVNRVPLQRGLEHVCLVPPFRKLGNRFCNQKVLRYHTIRLVLEFLGFWISYLINHLRFFQGTKVFLLRFQQKCNRLTKYLQKCCNLLSPSKYQEHGTTELRLHE